MKLFILSGQSNCVGKGCGDKLPAEYRQTTDNLLLYQNSWGLKGWQKLAPYPANPGQAKMYGCGDTMFGPEISFGHELRKQFPNDRIGIVKVCVGGTIVLIWSEDHGSPEWTRLFQTSGKDPGKSKRLYPQLTSDVRDAPATCGSPYEVCAFVWVQAEADSGYPEWAAAWAGRVWQLHHDLAADAGYSADIPLIVMGPHFHVWEKGQAEHRAQILAGIRQAAATGQPVTAESLRAACALRELSDKQFEAELMKMKYWVPQCYTQIQSVGIMQRGLDELARQHPNVRVVRSDDLPTHEGLHFDTAGVIELGQRLANALQASGLQPKKEREP